ncbi:hypothetical protein HLX78_24255, partial [Escherichia coli]|nr:hypothetical protein [Escherichia coli]
MSMAADIVSLNNAAPTIADVASIARRGARIEISPDVEAKINAARAVVE